MGIAPATVSQRLIADQGDDQTALSIDNSSDLQAGDIAKLREASVKSRFVNGAGPCVFYEYFNEQTIKDPDVRKAIATAINRQAVITAMNGALFGSIPQSFMPANVRGFVPPDLGLKDTGDTAAAQALLQGKTYPKTIKYSVSAGRPVQHAVGVQIQSDLKKIGITVNLVSIPTKGYYPALRNNPGPADMGMAGWCSDWPTQASSFRRSSVRTPRARPGARTTSPSTSTRRTRRRSPQLASSTAAPAELDKQFSDLANQIQTTNWPLLPVQASLNPTLVGSKIRNAGVSSIWSLPDLNSIGVAQ